MKASTLAAALLSAFAAMAAHAGDEAEFDEAFLYHTGTQRISTEQFRFGNPIAKGDYVADVYVNGAYRAQMLIRFGETQADPMRALCWSDELLHLLDLKEMAVKLAPDGGCVSAVDATPDVRYRFDVAAHRLDVGVPQLYLNTRPRGYVPRSSWQSGVGAAFVRYQLHGHHRHDGQDSSHTHFIGVQTGANVGRWSYRQSASASLGERKGELRHQEAYLQTDIDKLDGRLIVGDFYTQSPLLGNMAMRGLSLVSDSRMLPSSQTGYAPLIRGHANSDALVRIYQNDTLVHELAVAAGPFEIGDLPSLSSTSGQLRVEIHEADGVVRTLHIPFARSGQMLRPGQWRYHVSAGVFREGANAADKPVLHASAQYGVNNVLTAQAGVIAHKDYQSLSVGGVFGLPLGALTLDVDAVRGKPSQGAVANTAYKWHAGYRHYLSGSGTHISADAYHYLSDRYADLQGSLSGKYSSRGTPKQQYQLNISQNLGKGYGSVYATGVYSRQRDNSHTGGYQLGYSNTIRGVQYRFGVARSDTVRSSEAGRRGETSWFAHISIPLDNRAQHTANLNLQHQRQGGRNYSQAVLSSNFGSDKQYQYSLGISKADDSKTGVSAGVSAVLPAVRLSASASRQGDSRHVSYSASGAVVWHRYGISLANSLGDTFAVVRAKGASGAKLNNSGSRIDRFGNGIVPHLSAYQLNRIAIDAATLPADVETAATAQQLIPRANSAHLIEFKTQSGRLVLFDVGNTTLPPLAAAYDAKGNAVGQVVQDGRVLVRLDEGVGQLRIVWRDGACRIDYRLPDGGSELLIQPAECQAEAKAAQGDER